MSLCLVFTDDGELDLLDDLENMERDEYGDGSHSPEQVFSQTEEKKCQRALENESVTKLLRPVIASLSKQSACRPQFRIADPEDKENGARVETTVFVARSVDSTCWLDKLPPEVVVRYVLPHLARTEPVPRSLLRLATVSKTFRMLVRRAWPSLFPLLLGHELPAALRRFTLVLPQLLRDVYCGTFLECPICGARVNESFAVAGRTSVTSLVCCDDQKCGFRAHCPKPLQCAGAAKAVAAQKAIQLTAESEPFALLRGKKWGVRGLRSCAECSGYYMETIEGEKIMRCGSCCEKADKRPHLSSSSEDCESFKPKKKCWNMLKKGFCPYGGSCWFSHTV